MATKRRAKARHNGHGLASLDVEIQETPIVIGGRRRTIRLDMNALIALEEAGVDLSDPTLVERRLTLKIATTILWALLVHEDPELDVRTVRSWISGRNLDRVLDVVRESVEAASALPKADG